VLPKHSALAFLLSLRDPEALAWQGQARWAWPSRLTRPLDSIDLGPAARTRAKGFELELLSANGRNASRSALTLSKR
jgi:hypothetical protein